MWVSSSELPSGLLHLAGLSSFLCSVVNQADHHPLNTRDFKIELSHDFGCGYKYV